MKNFIHISEVESYGLELTDYHHRDLENKSNQLGHFAPICKIVKVLCVRYYDDKYHSEDIAVYLEYKGHLLMAYRSHYTDKTYCFRLVNSYRNKHTRDYRNQKERPQKVGKPTEKKMDQWLAYLLNEEEEKKEFAKQYIDQEAELRAELAQLGDAVQWENENMGHINKNNLVFKFTIGECYISKKVEIDRPYDMGLTEFLQMADNKYRRLRGK